MADAGDLAPNVNTYTHGAENTLERPAMADLRTKGVWRALSNLFVVGEGADVENVGLTEGTAVASDAVQPEATKFGMWDGVFARCLLNIFGVIMFLRLGWLVGYAGWAMTFVIILLSVGVTTITTLSLSAICTNGEVAGGGAYYMISRSLGAEFGGSIGLMFFVANAVAVALYLVGFALTITSQMNEPLVSATWDLRIIGLATLVFIQVLCALGVSWVVKVQLGLLAVLIVSILAFVIGCFTSHDDLPAFTGFNFGQGVNPDWDSSSGIGDAISTYNMSASQGVELANQVTSKVSRAIAGKTMGFGLGLAVFFPAVTGVMAGANISGDLRDASQAIPKGTLLSIAWSTVVYLFLAVCLGSVALPLTVPDGWEECGSISSEGRCTSADACIWEGLDSVCSPKFGGLWFDDILMAKIAVEPWLVFVGIYAATLSSAIASLVGAPRILQAVALDDLFGYLKFFKKGYGASNEPFPAYGLTFIIAFAMVMIGDINAIAPLITNFFMVTYAITNYACFAASLTNSPGWRPSFVYYNKWVSLIGAVACIALMMFMEYVTGFVTLAISFAIYKYIEFKKPATDWGSANEGYRYVSALRQMQRLEYTRKHVKNFRPAFLVLTGQPSESPGLAAMAANMKSGGGMCVFGDVVTYDDVDARFEVTGGTRNHSSSVSKSLHELVEDRTEAGKRYIASRSGMKAFVDVLPSATFWAGAQSLLHCSGLGEMRPNTLILSFPEKWQQTESAFTSEKRASSDREETKNGNVILGNGDREIHSAALLPALAEDSVSGFVATLGLAFDRKLGVAILRGESKLQLMPLALRVRDDKMHRRVKHNIRSSIRRISSRGLDRSFVGSSSFVRGTGKSESAEGDGDATDDDDDLEDAAEEEERARQTSSRKDSGDAATTDLEGIELQNLESGDAAVPMNSPITSHAVALALSNSKRLTIAQLIERQGGSQRIDVWWTADDGGLTVLLPYLLTQSPAWRHCKLRMMSLVRSELKVGAQTASLMSMMKKFRIDSEVEVVPNPEPQKVSPEYYATAEEAMTGYGGIPSGSEHTTRTQLKLGELIAHHSNDADLVVVTLPVPSISTNPRLYMVWIDALSRCDAPVLLVRGNQQDVLTFYS